jgi:hypothetical protein
MPWNIILTVILYLSQSVLAILGIYVSLKPLPIERHRLMIIVFIVVTISGISSGIGLQILAELEKKNQQHQHKIEIKEQKDLIVNINKELYQSHLSQEYMKGQLNAMGLLIGKGSDKMASAFEKMAQSYTQTVTTSNKQICLNTLDLVKRMQKFEYDTRAVKNQLSNREQSAMMAAKTKQEKDVIWEQYTAQLTQFYDREEYDFRTTLLGEAIYLRDELLKRLPPQPQQKPERHLSAFEGRLVGYSAVGETATYLENLARKLCPQ